MPCATRQVDGLNVGLDDVTRPNHLTKLNAKLAADLSRLKVAATYCKIHS